MNDLQLSPIENEDDGHDEVHTPVVEVVTDKLTPDELRKLLGNGASPDSPKSNKWAMFDDLALQPYTDFWDRELTLGENYVSIINRCVLLPNRKVQSKVVAAYAAVHSIACRVLPTLAIVGSTGTGKSALTKVIAGLREQHGSNTFGSSSTFASLRNAINKFRFMQFIDNQPIYERDNEKPCLMVIADVKEFFFRDPNKFALFRCGWDRSEETQTISMGNGENLTFYTFCPKILSTVDTFMLKSEYSELYRRSLFVKTEHIDKFSDEDKFAWYQQSNRLLEPDAINWTGADQEFLNFWHGDNDANLMEFARLRRQHGNLKDLARDKGMTEHQFKCCFDIMCTAKILFNMKPTEVILLFVEYFAYIKENVVPESEGVIRLIQFVIKDWTDPHELALNTMREVGIKAKLDPLRVRAVDFKSKYEYYKTQQGVMFGASELSIIQAMDSLGFHTDKHNGIIYWVWNK